MSISILEKHLTTHDIWSQIKHHMYPELRACTYYEHFDVYTAILNGYVGLIEQSPYLISPIRKSELIHSLETWSYTTYKESSVRISGPDMVTYMYILRNHYLNRKENYDDKLSVLLERRLDLDIYPITRTEEYAAKIFREIHTLALELYHRPGKKWIDELTYIAIFYLSIEQLKILSCVFEYMTWGKNCILYALMTDNIDMIKYVHAKRDPQSPDHTLGFHGLKIRDPKIVQWVADHYDIDAFSKRFHPKSLTRETLDFIDRAITQKKCMYGMNDIFAILLSTEETPLDTIKWFFEKKRWWNIRYQTNKRTYPQNVTDVKHRVTNYIGVCNFTVAKFLLKHFPYSGANITFRPDNLIIIKYIVKKFVLTCPKKDYQRCFNSNITPRMSNKFEKKLFGLYNWLYKHECHESQQLFLEDARKLWLKSKMLVDKSDHWLQKCVRFVTDYVDISDMDMYGCREPLTFRRRCIKYALSNGLNENHATWCVLLLFRRYCVQGGEHYPYDLSSTNVFDEKEVEDLLFVYELHEANGVKFVNFKDNVHKFVRVVRNRNLRTMSH